MTRPLPEEIALLIVEQGLLGNWRFYAVLLALLLLSTSFSVFLVKYVGKRAEVHATNSDLKEILRQLKVTTELTEQVKVAISHADWLAREWKGIRRAKLETLLETAISLTQWLDHQRAVSLFQVEQKLPSPPVDRVEMLGVLYFPELRAEIDALVNAQNMAHVWITKLAAESHRLVGSDREALLLGSVHEWLPLHRAVIDSVGSLKSASARVMVEIRGA